MAPFTNGEKLCKYGILKVLCHSEERLVELACTLALLLMAAAVLQNLVYPTNLYSVINNSSL